MVDTLKLAKRLEDAGLDRPAAEAMAEAFADATVETVATKQDLREQFGILRAEIQGTAKILRAQVRGTAQSLDAASPGTPQGRPAETRDVGQSLRAEMRALRRQVIGAIALMLLVHLGAVWGIVAAYAP